MRLGLFLFSLAVLLASGCSLIVDGSAYGGDGGAHDTGAVDSGRTDTGGADSGTFDTGAGDTGVPDTGTPDTGPMPCVTNADCGDPPWVVCSAGSCLDCDQDGDLAVRDVASCSDLAPGAARDCDDLNPEAHPGAVPVCGNMVVDSCTPRLLEPMRSALGVAELGSIAPTPIVDLPFIPLDPNGRYPFSVIPSPGAVEGRFAGGEWGALWADADEPQAVTMTTIRSTDGFPEVTSTDMNTAYRLLFSDAGFPLVTTSVARARSFGPEGDLLALAFVGSDTEGNPSVTLYDGASPISRRWVVPASFDAFYPIDISDNRGTRQVWYRGWDATGQPAMERINSSMVGRSNPKSVPTPSADPNEGVAISAAGPFAVTTGRFGLTSTSSMTLWDGESILTKRLTPFDFPGGSNEVGSATLVQLPSSPPNLRFAALLPRSDGTLMLRTMGCSSPVQSSCTPAARAAIFPGGAAHAAVAVDDFLLVFSAEEMMGEPTIVMRAFSPDDLANARVVTPIRILGQEDTSFSGALGIEASLGPVDGDGSRVGREVIVGAALDTGAEPQLWMGGIRFCGAL